MIQLMKCVLCCCLLVWLFGIWGYEIEQRFNMTIKHLPMQILAGFFAYYIVMQLVLLPVVFLHNDLYLASILVGIVTVLFTSIMLLKNRMKVVENVKKVLKSPWVFCALGVVGIVMIVAVLQQYLGYDTTYYVGEVNAFLYYGKFWTRDAFAGMIETPTIPLHYALSCFYPLCAVWAFIFHVDARIMMMFTVRALCVLLFACVTYSWGYDFFVKSGAVESIKVERKRQRNGSLFTIICLILCMFLMDDHSSSFMMLVRGYESKGYCAAVVAPMCTYALIQLCRDVESLSNWRLLGMIAWASMPIAMSSMAIIPVAIAVVGMALMIYHRQFGYIFKRCVYCVLPNMVLMVWYVVGTYLPRWKG